MPKSSSGFFSLPNTKFSREGDAKLYRGQIAAQIPQEVHSFTNFGSSWMYSKQSMGQTTVHAAHPVHFSDKTTCFSRPSSKLILESFIIVPLFRCVCNSLK